MFIYLFYGEGKGSKDIKFSRQLSERWNILELDINV